MKHTVYSIVLLILALMVVFATSCSDEKDEPVENKAKFTVMLYGCGGATLDDAFFDNLKQAIAYGSTDDVKMTYQMKLSKVYVEHNDVGNMEGTFRMMLPERRRPSKGRFNSSLSNSIVCHKLSLALTIEDNHARLLIRGGN